MTIPEVTINKPKLPCSTCNNELCVMETEHNSFTSKSCKKYLQFRRDFSKWLDEHPREMEIES